MGLGHPLPPLEAGLAAGRAFAGHQITCGTVRSLDFRKPQFPGTTCTQWAQGRHVVGLKKPCREQAWPRERGKRRKSSQVACIRMALERKAEESSRWPGLVAKGQSYPGSRDSVSSCFVTSCIAQGPTESPSRPGQAQA